MVTHTCNAMRIASSRPAYKKETKEKQRRRKKKKPEFKIIMPRRKSENRIQDITINL
jgi:hypothetical protein